MELEDIENVDKKNVEYINFFYYFLDDNDKLYFSMKNKYNLIKENFISKEEIFDQISYGKNKFLEKKYKLISILVHNNNSNPLESKTNNDSFVFETNGLSDIQLNKTYKPFLKLNSIHVTFKIKQNKCDRTKRNKNYFKKTLKNI